MNLTKAITPTGFSQSTYYDSNVLRLPTDKRKEYLDFDRWLGVAQGMGILLDLADQLSARADVGFLFVGRGSDAVRLKASAQNRGLNNVLFFDEIHPR